MKNLLRLTAFIAIAVAAVSCEKTTEIPEPMLEVTANNISGIWKLAEWSGGTLEEGSYVYMELTRRDQEMTIYQNLDSFSARRITGRYNIEVDEDLGVSVIRGQYYYGNGDWRHRYIVSELRANRMTWIAKDDADDISVYERCDAIPEEILAELPAAKE